jgi:signal transduction histidine kinase
MIETTAGGSDGASRIERNVVEMLVHDLQNPIAGIEAFLEIIRDRPGGLTPRESEGLKGAIARCQELSELVLSLLQLGQAERGDLVPDLELVDLRVMTKSTVDAFAPIASRRGQALRFRPSGESEAITIADSKLIRRILYNLTGNALRHTPAGTSVELSVTTEPSLQILVEDDGPGIPREIHDSIFEPGVARRAGLRSDSGIGLAFCRKAADALGMSLRFEENGNRGCRFVLEAGGGRDYGAVALSSPDMTEMPAQEVFG